MKRIIIMIQVVIFTIFFIGCISQEEKQFRGQTVENSQFREYWFNQEAELSRYTLNQSRYGEIHKGEAVLIFVTEDFFLSKQVKYEKGPYRDAAPVLKLNLERDFKTGIYPYHTMTSIFTPLYSREQKTLKVVSTFQEWCGIVYHQFNLKGNKYKIQSYSYFQNEGDRTFHLDNVFLEDELWTKLRINPDSIPRGKIRIIPGSVYSRFTHTPLKVEEGTMTIDEIDNSSFAPGPLKRLILTYTSFNRELIIYFEREFPYAIAGWEDTYPGGFGGDKTLMTTIAKKTHTIKLDYWNHNNTIDAELRKDLGLDE